MLPINETYVFTGKDASEYIVEIEIFVTDNLNMFPEGVSATFRLFVIDEGNEKLLVYLIDNHESRTTLYVRNWQEAWNRFQEKFKEKL